MKDELLKGFIYGVLVPLAIIYALAYFRIINFSKSGWILPGATIIGGAAVLLAGYYLIKGIFKR